MGTRFELHEFLCTILGSTNCYFQPPSSIVMQYPAIVYSRKDIENDYANDGTYKQSLAYEVIVIDKDPDSEIVYRLSLQPLCTFDRYFTSDNLNHYVFTLYF